MSQSKSNYPQGFIKATWRGVTNISADYKIGISFDDENNQTHRFLLPVGDAAKVAESIFQFIFSHSAKSSGISSSAKSNSIPEGTMQEPPERSPTASNADP